jgi:hypothetical protein
LTSALLHIEQQVFTKPAIAVGAAVVDHLQKLHDGFQSLPVLEIEKDPALQERTA